MNPPQCNMQKESASCPGYWKFYNCKYILEVFHLHCDDSLISNLETMWPIILCHMHTVKLIIRIWARRNQCKSYSQLIMCCAVEHKCIPLYQNQSSSDCTIDGGKWLASCSGCFSTLSRQLRGPQSYDDDEKFYSGN